MSDRDRAPLDSRPAPAPDAARHVSQQPWARVSAVVPTHERPEMLRRAVDAVLQQEYAGHLECVVVFDKSTPERPDVEVPPDRSLVLVENSRTPGLAGARNTGVMAATGELIGFCDDDDEWLQNKVRAQVELLAASPAATAVATGVYIHYLGKDTPRVPPPTLTLTDLLRDRHTEVAPSTFLLRRDALLSDVGLVDEALPGSYAEDYELLLRTARVHPLLCVPEPLARIYWHESSFYAGRWETILRGLQYLLDKHPEFKQSPVGLARIEGQMALAHAALGARPRAVRLAFRALRRHATSRQALAALAVSTGLVTAEQVLGVARRFGRGV